MPPLRVLSFEFCNGIWASKNFIDDPTSCLKSLTISTTISAQFEHWADK